MPYNNNTDEVLMIQVQKGNEAAFNEIYLRYSKRILLFLYRMLGQNETQGQDFLQDVFFKIAAQPEKFDTTKNFKTWIFTVAANLCKNYFRSKPQPTIDLNVVTDTAVPKNEDKIDQIAFKKELSEKLNQLLPIYKEAFLLKHHEGLTLKEIALICDCPVGTIKSRIHSATRILSEKLTHYQNN